MRLVVFKRFSSFRISSGWARMSCWMSRGNLTNHSNSKTLHHPRLSLRLHWMKRTVLSQISLSHISVGQWCCVMTRSSSTVYMGIMHTSATRGRRLLREVRSSSMKAAIGTLAPRLLRKRIRMLNTWPSPKPSVLRDSRTMMPMGVWKKKMLWSEEIVISVNFQGRLLWACDLEAGEAKDGRNSPSEACSRAAARVSSKPCALRFRLCAPVPARERRGPPAPSSPSFSLVLPSPSFSSWRNISSPAVSVSR
mmetsp:Transcript_17828/g.44207  ORF Transcript_17828/g.44207 Transcript_17828/m.44207 type:complete len:251 (+) Transcript_17828:1275-2027(+)